MDIQAYLDRIGVRGDVTADLKTLAAIHRSHVLSIPFENIDVLLGRRVDLDPVRIFDKLVARQRGGWCYEMNGLLGWALEEIGFDVTRLAGGVGRSVAGDDKVGNHLLLLVELDGAWIADVGFGNGLFEPVPLREGVIGQRGFQSRLEMVDHRWWRYHNPTGQDFDFTLDPASRDLLESRCDYLQTSPDSVFTQNLVIERQFPDRVEILRNSIRTTEYPDRVESRVLEDVDQFVEAISEVFGIDEPESRRLWPMAEARGREYLAQA